MSQSVSVSPPSSPSSCSAPIVAMTRADRRSARRGRLRRPGVAGGRRREATELVADATAALRARDSAREGLVSVGSRVPELDRAVVADRDEVGVVAREADVRHERAMAHVARGVGAAVGDGPAAHDVIVSCWPRPRRARGPLKVTRRISARLPSGFVSHSGWPLFVSSEGRRFPSSRRRRAGRRRGCRRRWRPRRSRRPRSRGSWRALGPRRRPSPGAISKRSRPALPRPSQLAPVRPQVHVLDLLGVGPADEAGQSVRARRNLPERRRVRRRAPAPARSPPGSSAAP